MSNQAALAAFLLLGGAFLPSGARAQDLPIPTEWDTHYVWFLEANPDYRPGSEATERALSAAHIQYQLRLQADGRAFAAGGLGPGEGDAVIGLTVLRASSLAEAEAIAAGDPAVQAGRLKARVREWWVPAGRLGGPGPGRS